MTKRIQVHYSGNVQGIGFRFFSHDLACELKLTGWVKNLEDGRVEMVAEGDEKNLKMLLEQIKENFNQNIKSKQVRWQEFTGEFESFKINKSSSYFLSAF